VITMGIENAQGSGLSFRVLGAGAGCGCSVLSVASVPLCFSRIPNPESRAWRPLRPCGCGWRDRPRLLAFLLHRPVWAPVGRNRLQRQRKHLVNRRDEMHYEILAQLVG